MFRLMKKKLLFQHNDSLSSVNTKPPPPPSTWMQEAVIINNHSISNFNQTPQLPLPPAFPTDNDASNNSTLNNTFISKTNTFKPNQTQQFFRPQPFSPDKNRHDKNYRGGISYNQRQPNGGGSRPIGPHVLNANQYSGNGAFIPLQAARKASSKKQSQKTSDNKSSIKNIDVANQQNDLFDKKLAQENNQNFAKFLGIVEKEIKPVVQGKEKSPDFPKTVVTPTEHVPRSRRIAARFPTKI